MLCRDVRASIGQRELWLNREKGLHMCSNIKGTFSLSFSNEIGVAFDLRCSFRFGVVVFVVSSSPSPQTTSDDLANERTIFHLN